MSSQLFCDIDLLDAQGTHTPHAYVGVRGNTIEYVGTTDPRNHTPESEAGAARHYDEVYDGRGKLLMPGLYNAHSHVPMTLLRGMGENMSLDAWLNDAIFPFEACMTHDDAYHAMLLGIAEMVRFGVVSCSDMYYHSDARAQAVLESGIKCNMGHSVLNFDPTKTYDDLPEASLNQTLLKNYHGAGGGRLLVDFNLHAEYTSTRPVVEGLAHAAKDAGVRMQVHLSETYSEVEECRGRHGLSPVEYLAECGLFDVPTTAAHCVWVDGQDRAILAEKGVVVATCPASNAKLGSGVAPVQEMRNAGVAVALGTDGVASNNAQNMFRDMYLLALMQRAHNCTPMGLSSAQLIHVATRNGALSQGRHDCGDIKEGYRADLVVLDIDTPWMQPCDDRAGALVYSAQGSDVVLTMVDGCVVYKDGSYPTIDIEFSAAEVCAARKRIISQLSYEKPRHEA